MSLSITTYTGLNKMEVISRDCDGVQNDGNGIVIFHDNPLVSSKSMGLSVGVPYTFANTVSFLAGSYTSYLEWREELANLAGYSLIEILTKRGVAPGECNAFSASLPFGDLLFFSDTEGTIGPVISAKLAKDFNDFQDKADGHVSESFKQRYRDFRMAFESAANNGAVVFH